jgi:hypothetical protein
MVPMKVISSRKTPLGWAVFGGLGAIAALLAHPLLASDTARAEVFMSVLSGIEDYLLYAFGKRPVDPRCQAGR